MASLNIELFSNCLNRATSFKMIIPTDRRFDPLNKAEENPNLNRPMRTLFLLHGYTGKGDCWIPEHLIEQYNFAVVCPSGENSFWLNGLSTGHAFQSFVGEELVDFVRKTFGLAKNREETYIMGLSMGGFGALHTALAYPDVFSKTAPLSSAFVQHEVANMNPGNLGKAHEIANYDFYRECFGEPSELLESEKNPETLVKKLLREKKKLPEIFMSIGTEDFLLEQNRAMHKFLEEHGVEHTYLEWEGAHDMKFWHESAEKFIPIMMK